MTGPILQSLQHRDMEYGPLQSDADESPDDWKHWRLVHDEQQVAWLFFDQGDKAVNVLGTAVLQELGIILGNLGEQMPKGLVLRSAKPAGFCVGADIQEFRGLDAEDKIVDKLQQAHAVADRLASLSCPKVAIIHGPCLGGGLELTLCCDYRLALPSARMGLPEVRLGLHPGLGGTARLTHLIDPVQAMTLMLTGKTLDARRAKKLGLVDAVIEERHIIRAVRAVMADQIESQAPGFKDRLLTTRPARQMEARQMRAKSQSKAPPEHYPAPGALIDLWEEHGGDETAMRRAEIPSFARLLTTETAQNLIRVFFLREKLKRAAKTEGPHITQVHVIGAGAMGGDIAGWCAYSGLRVSLHDTQLEVLGQAIRRTADLCRDKHLSAAATRDVLDRLTPDVENHGIGRADLVIEAVPEKLEIKRQVYEQVEPRMKPGAILATNTSSIPLQELARELKHPDHFIGLHFFNPVAKMQLVEVVVHDQASEETSHRARAFAGRIERLPVPVTSAPGFLVNRVLMPYLLEAILMIDEKVAPEAIDRAAEAFGMPMGPIELADHVGLDICLDVADMLRNRLETPIPTLPQWFRDRVASGNLGRKTGKGFYTWKDGKPAKKGDTPAVDETMLDRLLLPMLNTCMTCLREGVIADEELLDGSVIFGTGFAPFRGGPLHYARSRGVAEIMQTLQKLSEQHGERFTPDPGWTEST
ncbi:MAG: 3-hydroxyacyl-CoA dehydrogenase NAD-binding domain-containing protein [Desulfuromonadales bacterium]